MNTDVRRLIATLLEIDIQFVTDDLGPENFSNWDSLVHLSILEGLVGLYGSFVYESEKLAECKSVLEIEHELSIILKNNVPSR